VRNVLQKEDEMSAMQPMFFNIYRAVEKYRIWELRLGNGRRRQTAQLSQVWLWVLAGLQSWGIFFCLAGTFLLPALGMGAHLPDFPLPTTFWGTISSMLLIGFLIGVIGPVGWVWIPLFHKELQKKACRCRR
jgi:hypothetical protein